MKARLAVVISLSAALVGPGVKADSAAQELERSLRQPIDLAGLFPASEPGPLERRATLVTPENPIPRRTHLVRPLYPPAAAAVGARATVTLRATIDETGRVGEVRTVGVPVLGSITGGTAEQSVVTAALQSLVESATDAVSQWLYDAPADGPIAFDVVIGFTSDGDGEVLSVGRIGGSGQASTAPVVTTVPLLERLDSPPWAEGTVRVGGGIRPPTKVTHVAPAYPEAAKDAGVTGVVILEARIEADGRILHARVLRSIPPLDQAALDAVTQWEFTPTLVNGVPTPVMMTVTIQFSLQ